MKSAILHGCGDLRIEDVPMQALKLGEVRVEIHAALTCGTDLKVFRQGYHARMIKPPARFGHELAGIVSEVEASVRGWSAGDRVAVANSAPCGECFFCLRRQENLCENLVFLNGAYAESVVVPARIAEKNMVSLALGTGFADAALAEPLACVVLGVEDTRLEPGQRVLVIGAGPIGLMFVAIGKSLGCEVTVAGRGENRLRKARVVGADCVLDVSRDGGLMAAMKEHRLGAFDAVIEAVGKVETWEGAVQAVRKGGCVNFFGGCPPGSTICLDTEQVHYSSLTLVASFHHTPRTFRQALDLIQRGVIRAADFVDGKCGLDRLPELFDEMASGNRMVKTLVDVRGAK